MRKFLLIISLCFLTFFTSAYKKPDVFVIDAVKNANTHSNMGLRYLDEKCYYAAIQEFKIAISLNPNSQGTSVYYNNLGKTYVIIGYPKYAQDCFERAIKIYPLNFEYYKNLANCYKREGLTDLMISRYKKNTSQSLNMVMLGLLYIEKGDMRRGIVTLDEFTMTEPDLLITSAVKAYLKNITNLN